MKKNITILFVVLLCLTGCIRQEQEKPPEVPSGIPHRYEDKGLVLSDVKQVNIYRTHEPDHLLVTLDEQQLSAFTALLALAKLTVGGGQNSIASFIVFEVVPLQGEPFLINYWFSRLLSIDIEGQEENYTFANEEEAEQMRDFLEKLNIRKP